jgi:DNA-binding beta-propeller fold protein YncE
MYFLRQQCIFEILNIYLITDLCNYIIRMISPILDINNLEIEFRQKTDCQGWCVSVVKNSFHIFVADRDNTMIQILDHNFVPTGQIKLQYPPRGITIDSRTNYLYVCQHAYISIFDLNSKENNTLIRNIGRFCSFVSCAINSHNRQIYVTNCFDHDVEIYSEDGVFIRKFGSKGKQFGQFNHPWGIAINQNNGEIFISDYGNDRIQVFTKEGFFLNSFGSLGMTNGFFSHPSGICLDEHNDLLFIADTDNNRIQIFKATTGKYLTHIGGVSCNVDGHFQSPDGLYYDSKTSTLYVSDSMNYRIQVFDVL